MYCQEMMNLHSTTEYTCIEVQVVYEYGDYIRFQNADITKTHVHAEIAYFPVTCIIRAWKARRCRPRDIQVQMMHLVQKCVISTWAWVLAFIK